MTLWDRFRKRQTPLPGNGDATIDTAITGMRDRLHAADPDTSAQWHRLMRAMATHSTPQPAAKRHRLPLIFRPAFALAATAAVIGLSTIWFLTRSPELTYATAKGEQTDILLADSSRITLNHTSTLVVHGATVHGERMVSLTGEAFFRVKKTGGTFTVATGTGSVRVLGTEFNVRARHDRLEVSVVRGTVLVTGLDTTAGPGALLQNGMYTVCLAGGAPALPQEIPYAEYPGWLHGRLHFHRAPLAVVVEEIGDRFNVTVSLNRADARAQTLTGTVDARNVEATLAALCTLTGLRYKPDANGYSLY